jgi:hypothetical protein
MDGWLRVALLLALVVILGWALMAFGPVEHAQGNAIRFQDTTGVVPDTGASTGREVVVSGPVIQTDPVIVGVSTSGIDRVTLTGMNDWEISVGDRMYAFGTLTGPESVKVSRANIDDPWEIRYVFAASIVGGLIVYGRLFRDWRFNMEDLCFVPREEHAAARHSGDSLDEPTVGGGDD